MLIWLQRLWLLGSVGVVIALAGYGLSVSAPRQDHCPAACQPSGGADQHVDQRSAEDRVADYTLWLERFTGLLALVAVFQVALLIRGDQTARKSANAAMKAANVAERALSEAYRPYLTVHTISLAESAKTTIYFAISNIGDRAAIINGLHLRLVSVDVDGVESVLAEEAMDQRRVVKPNRDIKVTCRGNNPTGERLAHAKGGEISIHWEAAIHYGSPQGAAWIHRARARFRISAGEGSFEPPIWSDVADDPTGERMIPWPPKSKEQKT